jgi:hypothetical protein
MRNTLIYNIILWFSIFNSYAQKGDDIIGKYKLPNKIDVEIFKQNGKYLGKIIKLNGFEDGQKKDINNPEKSKQKDLLVGKVIIKNLIFENEEKQWINGTMYGAEKGLVFDLKITEIRNNEIEVIGSKYFFWKTLIWKMI